MNVRAWVLDPVKPLLPKDWRLVPYLDETSPIEQVTVMLALNTVEHHEEMPLSQWQITYDLFVVLPENPDGEAANDDIDDALFELLLALDESERIYFGTVERGVVDTHLFYRVPLTAVIKKVQDD